jgi:hypothetical protein
VAILKDQMESRKAAMKLERATFEPHWQEISSFVSTRTSRHLRSERNRGGKANQKIINETATLALRTLESGMMAGMSSPARPWFALAPLDPEMKKYAPVRDWLDAVTKIMLDAMARSNLYSALPKQYGSLGGYGTGAFGILEDEKEVFRCYPFPVGSFLIDCNSRLNVDTCYREFSMTVKQLVERFGKRDEKSGKYDMSHFSQSVRNHWDKGDYGVWIPVTHAVESNVEHDKQSLLSKHKAFRNVYYEDGGEKNVVLRESGFDEFPVMASRWHVNGEDTYGTRCPGMDALGSVKGLQLAERRKYQLMDKISNPAMNADAQLRNSGADLLPGGFNWVAGMAMSGNPGLKPVYEPPAQAIQFIREDIADVTERIRRCFYEDLMLMFAQSDRTEITAEEVRERHSEKLLVLGPMMEQQNDDLFDPCIDRIFNTMLRRGKFPPPPPEIQGQQLRVEYISIMAQAQKLVGVSSLERFVGFVGQVAQFNPSVLDKVNTDAAIEEYGIMTGVTGKIIVSAEDVAIVRENSSSARQSQCQHSRRARPRQRP